MSTALAIASVTQVLRDLLNNGIIDRDVSGVTGGNVTVTCLPPDRIDTSVGGEQSQLNLFMYLVTPNQGWRNQSMPSLDAQGNWITNPYLALDLHYLLSAYSPNELHPEILLGYGMQLLFETPVLPRDAIRNSLTTPIGSFTGGTLPANLRALSSSGLADQVEMIKIIPETMNTEEISKLWTAFQSNYRPTTAYRVTVVLIQAQNSTKSALPVQSRQLYVNPLNIPVINAIQSQSAPGQPIVANQKILPGYTLVLNGTALSADIVQANVDAELVIPNAANITPTQVSFALPSDVPAGVHEVTINQPTLIGSPPVQHQGVVSNAVSFILCPVIANALTNPVTVTNLVDNGSGILSANLALTLNPEVDTTQNLLLMLNQYFPGDAGTVTPLSYSFPAQLVELTSPPGPTGSIQAQISGVAAGTYLVRVQVDGAESPLYADATGKFYAPVVTLT
jgi:hypothetical protein